MEGTTITTTCWVPRGFAARNPRRVEMDEEEFDRIAAMAKLQLEDAQDDLDIEEGRELEGAEEDDKMEIEEEAPAAAAGGSGAAAEGKKEDAKKEEKKEKEDDVDAVIKEFDLDNYDEPNEDEVIGESIVLGNIRSLAYHAPGEEDPYITLKDDDDEEREELEILPTDNLLLVGKLEDEVAHLEVYVYEDEGEGNLYVHHDIMLPAVPLCLEWLDVPVASSAITPDSRGNFVAIGTTEPEIEIWDLDVVDGMFPNAILGQQDDSAKSRKKKKKKAKPNDERHVGAVQALAGNRSHRNLLASGSEDNTVKLWDLTTAKCAKSYNYHTGNVCALAWHPTQGTSLLSGSYDRTVVWADMRAPDAKQPRWGVESDVEQIRWDPHDPNFFYVSTEGGLVYKYDSRTLPRTPADSKAVWTLQAHDKACSSFALNPMVPGFLATGGQDKIVKLWNTESPTGGPSMVVSRDMDVGKVFSVGFAPDDAVGYVLSVAGTSGVVNIWDTSTNGGVRRVFGDRVKAKEGRGEDTVIAAAESDSDESDSEEEGGADIGDAGPDGWESDSMDEEDDA